MSSLCVLLKVQTNSSHIATGPGAIPNERGVELTGMISGLSILKKAPSEMTSGEWEPMCVKDLIIKCIKPQETLTENV